MDGLLNSPLDVGVALILGAMAVRIAWHEIQREPFMYLIAATVIGTIFVVVDAVVSILEVIR